ncbi:MAG: T9SS type A sorting domain-containing protein [Bacteroidales bacterium]|nr:T9SS type A sorting domain-containing protein [Bacteroidales bacterium]
MKKVQLLLMFVFICKVVFTQNYKEYYFKFKITEKSEIEKLTKIISIDNIKDNTVFAFATKYNFEQFQSFGYDYTLLNKSVKSQKSDPATIIEEMADWNKYPTYDVYVEMMNNYADNYPEICKVLNIGSTVDGRDLLVLKISDNINSEENEPELFFTSTMHGDETVGFILMLRLIDSILTSYGNDEIITNLVDEIEIYINPNANPDGTYLNDNNTVENPVRFNTNGVDLNRNFPDPEDGNHPDGYGWQPETVAMINFAKRHNIVLSANFHGGVELVNYPWDTWIKRHPDDDWLLRVSREYATLAQNNSSDGYFTDQDNGITNGYDWYSISGGRQDYYTFFHNSREFTVEISEVKHPIDTMLPYFWNYNKNSFFQLMNECLFGIRGTVTDSVGNPLNAMIFIENYDSTSDSSMIFTDPDVGDYHRLIESGTYNVIASAKGFINDTIKNIIVITGNISYNNFVLYPVKPVQQLQYNIYPNPFRDEIKIEILTPIDQKIEINIFNATGEKIFNQNVTILSVNTSIIEIGSDTNIGELPNGIYIVQVVTSTRKISYPIIKL